MSVASYAACARPRWYIGPELGSDTQITCYLDFHDVVQKFHLPTDHANRRLQYWNTKEWTMYNNFDIIGFDPHFLGVCHPARAV